MQFKSKLERFATFLWDQHIKVPEHIAQQFISDKEKRIVCTINDCLEFQCALMPKGNTTWFIKLNKEIRDKLNIHLGDSVNVEIKKDDSLYGLPLPIEMQELLEQDAEFNTLFHELTPGKQRSLLYIAGKPKNVQIRIDKSIIIARHLKKQNGKLYFKQLNIEFKSFNNR